MQKSQHDEKLECHAFPYHAFVPLRDFFVAMGNAELKTEEWDSLCVSPVLYGNLPS
jgi:hypothetical protein